MPNIVQLNTASCDSEERITKDWFDIEDELLRTVARYVDEDANHQETIQAFQNHLTSDNPHILPIYENGRSGFLLQPGFQDAYFKPSCESFIQIAAKLAEETTLDSFIDGSPDGDLFALREAYSDRFGWYVYYDTMTITLDDFMRYHAKVGDRYYYGGSVYYHI